MPPDAAIVDGTDAGAVFRWAGVVALLVRFLVTLFGTVPINAAALEWQPDAPPGNWKAARGPMGALEHLAYVGVDTCVCPLPDRCRAEAGCELTGTPIFAYRSTGPTRGMPGLEVAVCEP